MSIWPLQIQSEIVGAPCIIVKAMRERPEIFFQAQFSWKMCELTPLGDSSSEGGRGLMLIYLMAMKSGIWTMTSTCPICNTNDWKQDKNCHFDFGTLFQYLRQKLTLESKSAILIIFSAKIEILLNIKQIVSRIVLGLQNRTKIFILTFESYFNCSGKIDFRL